MNALAPSTRLVLARVAVVATSARHIARRGGNKFVMSRALARRLGAVALRAMLGNALGAACAIVGHSGLDEKLG